MCTRVFYSFFTALLVSNLSFGLISESSKDEDKVKAYRSSTAIKIDGILDEEIWTAQTATTDFVQREPNEGKNASEKTEVFIAYDDDALYVAAKCLDSSPDSIIARLSRRDVGTNDDLFGIFIDPSYDKRSGYYFGVSAAGTQLDGVLYNDRWDDDSWDGVWESKTAITDAGWFCEMRIPFSQLRFENNDKQVWGVNFRRDISRKNEIDFLVHIPMKEYAFVSKFKDLVGIENIKSYSNIEILPYVVTKAEYLQHSDGDPFNDGSRYSPGFGADIKTSVGSNLKLNATVNPDFGQVEIDPAVINLSDVETFFSEKRPFFIEGSTIFNFGQGGATNYWGFNWGNPIFFYSRRIGRVPQGSTPDADYTDFPVGTHILGAAKLSGKLDETWNFGTIHAFTQKEFAEIQSNGNRCKVEVEPFTYYGIVRAQKEFSGGQQGFGGIATLTARDFKDQRLMNDINKNAFTTGFDGWTFLDSSQTWVFAGAVGYTLVKGITARMISLQQNAQHYYQRPDAKNISIDSNATSLSGYGGRFVLNKQKGNFFFNSAFGFLSPGFDVNDMGFLYRADIINMHVGAGYFWNEPTDSYRYLEFGGAWFKNLDFDGNSTWGGLFHFGSIQFLNYYWLNWNLGLNEENLNTRMTRGGPMVLYPASIEASINTNTDYRKSWGANLGFATGGKYNYPFYWQISGELELKPLSNVVFSISPFFTRDNEYSQYVDVIDDVTAINTFGKRYVFAKLTQNTFGAGIRLNWTFTPKLSIQVYMQPLISSGDYSNFKELAKPRTYNFTSYNVDKTEQNKEEFFVDPDGNGPSQGFTISNPDFNYKSLRGNAVLRWEYLPGSVLYFVWTQTRSDIEDIGEFRFKKSFNRLFDAQPDNIFLVKFSYWLNI